MNDTAAPQFLAGWYLRPDETSGTYDSCHAQVGNWNDAARWLRDQLNARCEAWGSQEVETRHVAPGANVEELSFPDCRAFADWAMTNRRGRGVLGFDGDRYFYIIRADKSARQQPGSMPRRPQMAQPGH